MKLASTRCGSRWLIAIWSMAVCTMLIPGALAGLVVSDVAVEPTVLRMGGEQVRIAFYVSEPSAVTLYILDPDGWPIKTLMNETQVPAGRSIIQWNGTDDAGQAVPNEAYTVYIHASNDQEQTVYNPGAQSGGMAALVYPEITQSSLPIQARFTLTEPLRVRMRIGIDNGPLLATPLDWQPQSIGDHTISWDAVQGGATLKVDLTKVKVIIDAFTLPDHTIVTLGNSLSYSEYKYRRAKALGAWHELLQQGIGFEARPKSLGFQTHAGLTRILDREPVFTVGAKVGLGKTAGQELTVEINLEELTAWVLPQSRYEVKLYIDNELIIEEEQGIAPYTFHVPWNDAWGDEAQVTINVATLHDQVGSMSRRLSNP